jgi:hypothetical protein
MELHFYVREEDGLLVTVCKDPNMATQGRTLEELTRMVRGRIACHFDEGGETSITLDQLRGE